MSGYTDLLDQLPIPDHHPDFWTNLESKLADEPTATEDPDPVHHDGAFVDLPDDEDDTTVVDLQRRRARRWFFAAIAATAAAVVGIVIGYSILSEDTAPGPVVTDLTPLPTTEITTSTTTAPPAEDADAEPPPGVEEDAGQSDLVGPATAGLFVEASATTDLVDGEVITVRGTGHGPGEQVAVLQCYGPIDENGDVDACDLSKYEVVNASDLGNFLATVRIHRFITSATGTHDCAHPEAPDYCVIAAGAIGDFTKYGLVRTVFDAAVPGSPAPVLEVSPTTGLLDGDTVTVVGRDFVPREQVRVAQCPLSYGCSVTGGFHTATADESGGFMLTMPVWQELSGPDCVYQPLGCRMGALAGRDTYPIVLEFDPEGPRVSPPAPSATPTEDLVDGDVVTIDIPLMGETIGETFEARQCRNGDGDRSGDGYACGAAVTGVIGSDGTRFEFAVTELLDADLTSLPECANSFGIATCHIQVETPSYTYPEIRLAFDPERATQPAPYQGP